MDAPARQAARQLGLEERNVVAYFVAKHNSNVTVDSVTNQTPLGAMFRAIIEGVNQHRQVFLRADDFGPESTVVDILGQLQDLRRPSA